jgi:hypothetical protein
MYIETCTICLFLPLSCCCISSYMVVVRSLAYILSYRSHLTPCEWYGLLGCVLTNRVESSRVESSRVGITKSCRDYLANLIMAARRNAYTPAESSRATNLAESSLDFTCFIFVSRFPVIGHDGCYFALKN